MTVEEFEIVDLGVAPEGAYDVFGPSFGAYARAVVGIGDNGMQALQDALDQIAIQGLDASSVEVSAREASYFGQDAETSCEDLIEGDEMLDGTPVKYYVGIRFDDPREATEEEGGDAAQGEDEDGEGDPA